jgi:hypothetical protein
VKDGELTVAVLPLRRDAVTGANPLIYIPAIAMPDFAGQDSVARIDRAELVPLSEAWAKME